MPNIRCVSIVNPVKGIGETCNEQKSRRSGMFCTKCKDNAIKLLTPNGNGNFLLCPPEWLGLLQQLWKTHCQKNEDKKKQKNKDSQTRQSNKRNLQQDQTNQNESRKKHRKVFTQLKKTGDLDGLVAAGKQTTRYQNRLKTATARGYDDENFDFERELAEGGNIRLAAAVTDASVNHVQSTIRFRSKGAATKAMADLMIVFKGLNNKIMKYSCQSNYDLTKASSITTGMQFVNRGKTESKCTIVHSSYSADDTDTIATVEDYSEQVDHFRKAVYDWHLKKHGHGVVARYNISGLPKPSRAEVLQMVHDNITERHIQEQFSYLLTKERINEEEKFRILSLLNGTVFMYSESTTAFHFCPEITAFSFPSSHSNAVKLVQEKFESVLAKAGCFIGVWLSRYPRPNRCVHDNGGEFIGGEFQLLLQQWGIKDVATTSHNPQANSICERMHQTVGNILRTMLHTLNPQNNEDAEFIVDHALAATMHATRCSVNRMFQESPGALCFSRDMILDIPIIADLQGIQMRRQTQIDNNLLRQNSKRRDFDFRVGQQILVESLDKTKLSPKQEGPYNITTVYSKVSRFLVQHQSMMSSPFVLI